MTLDTQLKDKFQSDLEKDIARMTEERAELRNCSSFGTAKLTLNANLRYATQMLDQYKAYLKARAESQAYGVHYEI